MENEVTIPVLEKFECPRCKRQAVAEQGSQMLCQPCTNEFLARNVGMMQPVVDLGEQQVVPLTDPLEGTIERAALKDGVGPDFLPGVEGPHGGGTG